MASSDGKRRLGFNWFLLPAAVVMLFNVWYQFGWIVGLITVFASVIVAALARAYVKRRDGYD